MQKLKFEAAWDKTISPQDREYIENVFTQNSLVNTNGVEFTFLKEATNHNGHLLVTMLIHNRSEDDLAIDNAVIEYRRKGQQIATDTFKLPFVIPPKISMPWTFIYTRFQQVDTIPEFIIEASD